MKHDSYKDSGIEWIGRIPSGWSTNRLKWISQIDNSGVWGEDDEYPNSINVPIPTTGQLSIDGDWYYEKMNLRNLSNDEWNKYKCIEGDILVVKSSGSSTNIITGKCGFISEEDSEKFGFSNFMMRVRPNKMIPKLVYYFLSSNLTKQRIERMVSSTTYPNLKVDEYSNSKLLIPPFSEQKQIVSYLDTKILTIDSLIKKIQQKIELLKEQKISLISEIVTKGLNSNTETKDCGVEWIGEIPKDWGFIKLKRLFFINKRISGELGFDVLSVTQNGLKVKDLENSMGQHSMDYTKYQLVHENDFVMNHMDLLTGYVDISKQTGVTSPDYRVFTRYNDKVFNNYYLYIFQLFYKQRVFYGLGRGVSNMGRWRLPSVEFLNMYLPLPPYSEQQEIVEYLDKKTEEIDKTISIEEKRINLLKEYKQSLISEVVTGKKRVV